MEKSRVIPFYDLCRLCLEQSGAKNIFDILELSDDIFTCTGVQIFNSEKLPTKICVKCYETVQLAKNLRLLAMRSDSHLRLIFGDDVAGPEKENDITLVLHGSSNERDIVITCSDKNNQQKSGISVRKDLSDFPIAPCKDPENSLSKENKALPRKDKRSNQESDGNKLSKKIKVENKLDGYVCGTCSKMFASGKKLYTHQRTHNKKYFCPLDVCEKKFTTRADLNKHIRTHTGEKPYKCDVCDKRFTQQVTLRAHKEALHKSSKGYRTNIVFESSSDESFDIVEHKIGDDGGV